MSFEGPPCGTFTKAKLSVPAGAEDGVVRSDLPVGGPPSPEGSLKVETSGGGRSPDSSDSFQRVESPVKEMTPQSASSGRGSHGSLGSFVILDASPQLTPPGSNEGTPVNVKKLITELQRMNQNPQAVWLLVLQEYREVPLEQWPMPVGYTTRVAPQYLTKVYSVPGRTGLEYGEKFLADHGLNHCTVARTMVDALGCVDRLMLEDRPKDLVNLVSLEHLARKAYGVEVAFDKCQGEGDWRKPKNAAKDWSSKVDFDMMARVDPSMSPQFMGGEYMKSVRDEVKREMLIDIDFAKVRNKAQQNGAIRDLAMTL